MMLNFSLTRRNDNLCSGLRRVSVGTYVFAESMEINDEEDL
jgi:hypothetical protein